MELWSLALLHVPNLSPQKWNDTIKLLALFPDKSKHVFTIKLSIWAHTCSPRRQCWPTPSRSSATSSRQSLCMGLSHITHCSGNWGRPQLRRIAMFLSLQDSIFCRAFCTLWTLVMDGDTLTRFYTPYRYTLLVSKDRAFQNVSTVRCWGTTQKFYRQKI